MKLTVVATFIAAASAVMGLGSMGHAASVVDEWASIKQPAPPVLKPVTVDKQTTALLMLDFMNQNCGKRPRCVAQIPAMKKLVEAARAAKVLVVYSLIANTTTADVIKDVAPQAGEPHVLSGPDKFFKTDLEKILTDKGIKTVIIVGTAANGAVMFTANSAALRGLNVIIPVDGMSAVDPFVELFTAVHMATGPAISAKSTLTRSDMIKF